MRAFDGIVSWLPVNGADEVHSLDLVGLGALLDDHRQTAIHLPVQTKEEDRGSGWVHRKGQMVVVRVWGVIYLVM